MSELAAQLKNAPGPLHQVRVSPDELDIILRSLQAHGGSAAKIAGALIKTTPLEMDEHNTPFRTIIVGAPALNVIIEAVLLRHGHAA